MLWLFHILKVIFGRILLKKVLKVWNKNKKQECKYIQYIYLELDQEEEDRKKQEFEAAKVYDDGGFDDPIEPEDPTDVNKIKKSSFLFIYISKILDFW